jgi:aerobic-type carbon monoxide dehydrogenase small subunit (CoxS/CutS family)
LTCEGTAVTTIEGASRDRRLRALQEALVAGGGLQCGYCTPGIVLAAHGLFESTPEPDEASIRDGISNNLCRCTGYLPIVEALMKVAAMKHYRPEPRSGMQDAAANGQESGLRSGTEERDR